ncbi:unnamed protein product [Lymnaea stagnalis]|uniref:Uncharacterized protein n=1 Tax=Lymnaea stagnalis TaxID=6523 RepID=A0AAV2HLQ7_LYMST
MSSSTSTYINKDCDCVCKDEKQILLDTYKDISDKMWHIISQARENIQDSVDDFVAKQIGRLFQIVPVYKKAFEGLNVKTKAEFEKKASHYFRDQFVREEFDELIQNEREWDDLLKDVDKTLSSPDAIPLEVGDTLPLSLSVINARSKVESSIKSYLEDTKFIAMILLRHFA